MSEYMHSKINVDGVNEVRHKVLAYVTNSLGNVSTLMFHISGQGKKLDTNFFCSLYLLTLLVEKYCS